MTGPRSIAVADLVLTVVVALYALAVVSLLAAAAAVLWVAPRRSVNRSLALALTALGANYAIEVAYELDAGDPWVAYNYALWYVALVFLWRIAYLLFIGDALDTPLAAPLRNPWVRRGLVTTAAGAIVLPLLLPASFVGLPAEVSPGRFVSEHVAWFETFYVWGSVIYLYALAAALSAYRRAPAGSIARSRAKAYAIGFGIQDLGHLVGNILPFLLGNSAGPSVPSLFDAFVYAGSILLALGVLAHAVLRYQLFDIDLKLKWTLQQSTVLLAFIATYLIGSEVARLLLAPRFGALSGVIAAGLLFLLLIPLQRAGGRLADALMPQVRAGDEAYLRHRKEEVYRAALEDLSPGGARSASDHAALERLREKLALSGDQVAALERSMDRGPVDLTPGALAFGRYRIVRMLGQGGEGVTRLCRDERLGRDVVLKTLPAGIQGLQEARALARIRSPHVVAVHDAWESGGETHILMEYCPGGSLAGRLQRTPRLGVREAMRIADELLVGLEAAHAAGIVHRDVKPDNLLFDAEGRAKVADFGIAGRADATATARVGAAAGTLRYMAPEQVRGEGSDARTDLYASGLVLYEMLMGRPLVPPQGLNDFETRQTILLGAPPLDALPPEAAPLRDALEKALQKHPAKRPSSASEMRATLASVTLRPSTA